MLKIPTKIEYGMLENMRRLHATHHSHPLLNALSDTVEVCIINHRSDPLSISMAGSIHVRHSSIAAS
jgi:hypothetical protein